MRNKKLLIVPDIDLLRMMYFMNYGMGKQWLQSNTNSNTNSNNLIIITTKHWRTLLVKWLVSICPRTIIKGRYSTLICCCSDMINRLLKLMEFTKLPSMCKFL
ncbi:hypothetical protein EB796_006975 [Bugula neritina]|uniref:Uncharacterized protein n=1 Tax=Bugula neritina TaxID=10212 RepID=A0A7J7KAX3_BUGNE|nr:hypothetical protein EB796_006975 [Bugula neritina]